LLAYSFEPAKVVVLAEQSLSLAALFSLGEQDHPDLFQLYLSSLRDLVGRRFVSFHAADLKKFEAKCPAKSALALFLWLQCVFMHTRCERSLTRPVATIKGTVTISWVAISGTHYQIQSSDTVNGTYTNLAIVLASSTAGTYTDVTVGPNERFYKVVQL
jgi:hypothetical protein